MPTPEQVQVCRELNLDPDALYDANTASKALCISGTTLKYHRRYGNIKCEQADGFLTGYRGWHIAERFINRRGH